MKELVNLEERVNINGGIDLIAFTINGVCTKVEKELSEAWIERFGSLIGVQNGLDEEEYQYFYNLIEKTSLKFGSVEELVASKEFTTITDMLQDFFSTRFFEGIIATDNLEIRIQKVDIENLSRKIIKTRRIRQAINQGYLYIDYLENRIKSLEDFSEDTWNCYINNRDKALEFIA